MQSGNLLFPVGARFHIDVLGCCCFTKPVMQSRGAVWLTAVPSPLNLGFVISVTTTCLSPD
jgi:hypothetical protein